MVTFSKLPKKNDVGKKKEEDKIIRRTFSVDYRLYDKLKYLTDNIYDVSINKLVNICIKELIETENIKLYKVDYKEHKMDRTYLIPKSYLLELEKLKSKYNISVTKLINIAIYNAIENDNKK